MKKPIKVYLSPEAEKALKQKANSLFEGRGSISSYITKIALEPICFLDENVRVVLGALNLVPK